MGSQGFALQQKIFKDPMSLKGIDVTSKIF